MTQLDDDGWCITCGDPFHYDDTGGYNPPCVCGWHCRSCHEAEAADDGFYGDDDDYRNDVDERAFPHSPETPE